jgi:hypothetical protein
VAAMPGLIDEIRRRVTGRAEVAAGE